VHVKAELSDSDKQCDQCNSTYCMCSHGNSSGGAGHVGPEKANTKAAKANAKATVKANAKAAVKAAKPSKAASK
jgi:hypothetical protein